MSQNEFHINLSNWKIGDYNEYKSAEKRCKYDPFNNTISDQLAEKLAMVVKEWPYSYSPTNPFSFHLITAVQALKVRLEVEMELARFFNERGN